MFCRQSKLSATHKFCSEPVCQSQRAPPFHPSRTILAHWIDTLWVKISNPSAAECFLKGAEDLFFISSLSSDVQWHCDLKHQYKIGANVGVFQGCDFCHQTSGTWRWGSCSSVSLCVWKPPVNYGSSEPKNSFQDTLHSTRLLTRSFCRFIMAAGTVKYVWNMFHVKNNSVLFDDISPVS